MRITKNHLKQATRFVAAAMILANLASVQAASIYKPEDSKGAISTYELLGVKLGMSEADAIAAIKKRFPTGSKDSNNRPINLQQSDYVLTSPATRARVKAGVRFDLHPESKNNFDFVKLFLHDGKVWAIWRDDLSGRYEYPKMVSDNQSKYVGAAEIKGNAD